ncbi:MAG: ribonuclease HI [Bifidobacteriaceae bacterium]|nr:ribonuclease HI [Bifidobacteriaceae bacterium]
MSTITVSTDGSALGNPNGAMGWAWADHVGGGCDAGGAGNGTNQIGELCAVLQALRTHKGADTLVIESDSQYAIKCSTVWLNSWKRNGWHNSQKKPVKNATIIKAIDYEISHREGPVKFHWVKGHAGNEFNEKCDMLARGFAQQCKEHGSAGFLPIEGWVDLIASPYASRLKVPDDVRDALRGGEATVSQTIASTVRATSYGNRKFGPGTAKAKAPANTEAADDAMITDNTGIAGRNRTARPLPPASHNRSANQQALRERHESVDEYTGELKLEGFSEPARQQSQPDQTTQHRVAPQPTAQAVSRAATNANATASPSVAASASPTAAPRRVVEPTLFPSDAPTISDQAALINRAARQLLDASERLEQATERYEDAAEKLEAVIKRLDDATRNNRTQGTLF